MNCRLSSTSYYYSAEPFVNSPARISVLSHWRKRWLFSIEFSSKCAPGNVLRTISIALRLIPPGCCLSLKMIGVISMSVKTYEFTRFRSFEVCAQIYLIVLKLDKPLNSGFVTQSRGVRAICLSPLSLFTIYYSFYSFAKYVIWSGRTYGRDAEKYTCIE